MIDLIDKKILAIILIALLLGGGAAALAYYYVMPAEERYQQEANSIKSQASQVQSEIDRIRFEFDKIQSQIDSFKALQAKGFFNNQDRVTARDAITRLTRHAKVGADIKFSPAGLVPNAEVEGAKYKLLSGPISISLRSMNDVNAYKFIVGLQRAFPGYLQLRSFSLSRDGAQGLQDQVKLLRSGQKVPVVTGSVGLIWWTMASEEQLRANPILDPTVSLDAPGATSPAPPASP